MLARLRFVAVSIFVVGCGGSNAPVRPRAALWESRDDRLIPTSTASWRYHPNDADALEASLDLDNGDRIFVGHKGERWLYERQRARVTPASSLAPETLVGAQRSDGSTWIFVGESGSCYESTEPLGPFTRVKAPLEPLVHVSADATTLLGIRRDGRLLASRDAGTTWSNTGPREARFVDVILGANGAGLALEIPERYWRTLDRGRSWQAVASPPLGVIGFARGARGPLARSAFGALSVDPESSTPMTPAAVNADTELTLPVAPEPAPNVAALLSAHAQVLDGSYLEVARSSARSASAEANAQWRLLSGALDASLTSTSLQFTNGCGDLKLAGFQRWLYLACLRGGETKLGPRAVVDVELLRSDDRGRSWQRVLDPIRATWEHLELAVGDGGTLIAAGVCAVPAEPGCQPSGIRHATWATLVSSEGLRASAVPALREPVDALTFSSDGRNAYAVGRRTKSDAVAIFVSHDGGARFDAHEVEGLSANRDLDDSESVQAIGAGADGSVSVVLPAAPGREARLLMLDAEGRATAIAAPPVSGAAIGASGALAIAVSRDGSDVWESLNGGTQWQPIAAPPAPPLDSAKGGRSAGVRIFCHASGCELSGSVSRLGWRGQSEPGTALLPPPHAKVGVLHEAVRTPIACSLSNDPWHPVPGLARPPTADQAALGGFAWFAVATEPNTGLVTSLRAHGGKSRVLERVALLPPTQDPSSFAYSVSLQIEGSAALRYRASPAHDGRIQDVEVAWDDLVHSTLAHARIADAGSYRAGDADRNGRLVQVAHPDLISISAGGLYLRLHQDSARDQPTYFVEKNRITTLPPLLWPQELPSGRQEIVRVSNADLPIRVIDSATIARGSLQDQHWSFVAETFGWPDPTRFGLEQTVDLTYLNGFPALEVIGFDPGELHGEAYILPFNASGPLFNARIPAPTQADLAPVPEACSAAVRRDTARSVLPLEAGMRHPVVIRAPTEPTRVLLTERAVLYGTKEHPCAAAFDAESVNNDSRDGAGKESVLVLLDDLDHAWLFRDAHDGDADRVEYRGLECRFDPTLEAPPEVFSARGTLVAR